MKRKNEIEQELDQKEFESEIDRDLAHEYRKIDVEEMFYKDKNKYVVGALNFFSTLVVFEVLYWLLKTLINFFTLGFTLPVFEQLNPFVHVAILILGIHAVYTRKTAVIYILKLMPNGWS